MECNGNRLNPVVVLTDIMKSAPNNDFKLTLKGNESLDWTMGKITSRLLTPPRSTTSPTSSTLKQSVKKQKTSWDPSVEYEVEKILDCQMDKKGRTWYLIKWKGWSKEYNTLELIDNLTSCNYKLMKFFEAKRPTAEVIENKNKEIKRSLVNHEMYKKLCNNGYRMDDLEEFSKKCMDISKLFDNSLLNSFKRAVRREYLYIVRCLIGMGRRDPILFLRGQNHRICLNLIKLRRIQLAKNMKSEVYINSLEKTLIKIENNVDLDIFPNSLNYVVESVHGDDVIVPKDPLLGCECSKGCTPKSRCCGVMADSIFAYKSGGVLRLSDQIPIYECNWRCKCPETCPNRVVQHGRRVKLCIFKTYSCGWGVKTLEKIEKGAFVCEYVGEIIPDSKAVVRDVKYCKQNISYLFDLDFNPDHDSNMYCIDATKYGNVARFINHSCDPNLIVYPVWIDCLEPNLHKLAFFARRNIEVGEEIHFDYENIQNSNEAEGESDEDKKNSRLRTVSTVRCQCKSSNCRKWVFGNK